MIFFALLFCSALINCAFSQEDPIVTISDPVEREQTAFADTDYAVVCTVENLPQGSLVRWNHFNDEISIDTESMDPYRFRIDKPATKQWRLIIRNVRPESKGKYECRVQVDHGQYASAQFFLEVVARPRIMQSRSSVDTTVRSGDNVRLYCNATGIPRPVIQWSRADGGALPIGGVKYVAADGLLDISKVRPADRGTYTCEAINQYGHDFRRVKVDVRFEPQARAWRSRVFQAPGYNADLICYIEANPIGQHVTWSRAGAQVQGEHYLVKFTENANYKVTSTLTILGVRDADYGEFSCQDARGGGQARFLLARAAQPQNQDTIGAVRMPSAAAPPPVRLGAVTGGVLLGGLVLAMLVGV